MSLDKAIDSGKEHRKPYRRSKVFDYTCRNHGGRTKKHCSNQCPYCLENRMHKYDKENERIKRAMEDVNE